MTPTDTHRPLSTFEKQVLERIRCGKTALRETVERLVKSGHLNYGTRGGREFVLTTKGREALKEGKQAK